MQTQSFVINFTGGIVSPGYLKDILELAKEARVSQVRFGLRQQLRLEVPSAFCAGFMQECRQKNINVWKAAEAPPNIVSSYAAAALFTADGWMREGVYKDIFDALHFTPRLKVNICDGRQSFVPFHTGHINWVASASQHFWTLYLRFPKTGQVYRWKELVYTNDIPAMTEAVEQQLLSVGNFAAADKAGEAIFRHIKSSLHYIAKAAPEEPLTDFSLPYYEGFNRMNNQWWLGIYRRNEQFGVDFLLDVCQLCLQTRIGQLYTTPWKSIIVKSIESDDRKRWDLVLNRYRINVRHAANELAWQVEDDIEKGLQLKGHIIRHFDKEDVRTYGLCFAVQSRPTSSMFGSVVIRLQPTKNPHRLKALERYDILYKKDFNPNAEELMIFREGVEKDYIGTYLVSLCKYFYEGRTALPLLAAEAPGTVEDAAHERAVIHQCRHCQTVYVPAIGDNEQGVPPGTSFAALPPAFVCPLCEAPKEAFTTVEVEGSL